MWRKIVLAWGLLACAATAWAQEGFQSPGFEDLDGGTPRGWTFGGGAEVIEDAGVAHSGRRCAKARFEDAASQRLAIEGGAAYRITGWIRRVEPGGTERPKIKVYFLDADGHRADVQACEFEDVTADGWRSWETVVQAPVHAKTLNLTLRGLFGGSEWFYYDDLAIERVEALSWPAREATPSLDGLTVTVPDVADVWTDALLRIPPGSLVPIDGRLDTSVLTRGEDVRVQLERRTVVSWALVHSMRPGMSLGEARLFALTQVGCVKRTLSPSTIPTLHQRVCTLIPGHVGGWCVSRTLLVGGDGLLSAEAPAVEGGARRLLAESMPKQELVTSLRFEPTAVREFVLEVPDDEIHLNEIQLLGLSKNGKLAGERVEMAIARAAPPQAVAEDLAAALGAKEHRASLVASPAGDVDATAPGEMALPAEQYLNVFATPREGEYGLAGLGLELALSGAEEGDMIEVTLRRPEELDVDVRWTTYTDRGLTPHVPRRNYATVFRVVGRVGDGRLAVTFDVPDLIYPPGEPVWLTLRARHDMTLDLARSRVVLGVLTSDEALAEYVPQLERLVRRMYSDASEAHAYDGRDWSKMVLGRYVRRVLGLDPENEPATYVYRRIAKVREPVEPERPGPADAPDWAVWARRALRNRHEIITWWLDHRQQANGELAGHINDDGEFSCHWPSHYLMADDERIADGLRKLADVAWEMSAGTGYTVGSRDVEHAAEDQSCTQPQVLLVDYGNPKAVERFMVMSRYLDFWTAVNEAGRRQFKSYMFTTKQIWDEPPFDVDHPYCPLAMVGTGHLVWYTESPAVAEIFLEEAESWARGCLSTAGGKPEGQIPKEIRFRDSQIDPYAPYPTNPILEKRNSLYRGGAGAYIVSYFLHGAHTLTGDDLYGRVVDLWTPPDDRRVEAARATLERFNEQTEPREGTWSASQGETTLYEAWRATGDRTWLVEELKEVVRQQVRNRWLLTEAEPYTDRIPLPGRELLCRMFLGGWTSGKSHVPGHWVSWEGGGLDYAALILDAKPNHLKTLVHSFHEREQPMTMRVWRLPHGHYDVSIGIDRDGDDQLDERLRSEEMELWRYDGAVDFTARPGQTLVIELSLVEELDDVRTRPDLAIGPDDVAMEDGAVVVTVHNLGGSASPDATIEVRAAGAEVLGAAQAPALGPPHDLEPKTAEVRIPLEKGTKPARIVLDPANEIAEITEANNRVRLPAR